LPLRRVRNVSVDAAVRATSVRVDRAVEADVRAVVAGDDGAGALDVHHRLDLPKLAVLLGPAVVEGVALERLEPPRDVDTRTLGRARSIMGDRPDGRLAKALASCGVALDQIKERRGDLPGAIPSAAFPRPPHPRCGRVRPPDLARRRPFG
jgi:hypothetical protein